MCRDCTSYILLIRLRYAIAFDMLSLITVWSCCCLFIERNILKKKLLISPTISLKNDRELIYNNPEWFRIGWGCLRILSGNSRTEFHYHTTIAKKLRYSLCTNPKQEVVAQISHCINLIGSMTTVNVNTILSHDWLYSSFKLLPDVLFSRGLVHREFSINW